MISTEDWSGNAEASADNDEKKETETTIVERVIPGYDSFDDYLQEAFDVIRVGIKAANNFPSGENFSYYACFPIFNAAASNESKKLVNLMQNVIGVSGICSSIRNRDVEEKFDLLLETNDIFLDRANTCMDEESGILKNSEIELVVTQMRKQTVNSSWNVQRQQTSENSDSSQSVRLLAGKNIQRPQLMFKDKIDNSSKPWCPRIKEKPNSLKPLAIYLEEDSNGEVFNHPYEFELDRFTPPEDQLKKQEPVKYKSLEETPLIMIENPQELKMLLDDLKDQKQIAVDLEHHSYRTFQGITCLMQISTMEKDYLIDTLTLRSELHELNEIFTKPTILKVFHGADLDVQWLQRDLALYVVNMFDTHQAAKQLNLPYLSLAYLLKRYCNIDPNKHFQLADWRIRPLPDELMKYAREDTHYLLYIKDILRNALIDVANGQTNILKAVYDRSTEICKKTYVKPVWTEQSYQTMYRKSKKMFNNRQLYALKELHKWRDTVAREEDDSTAYVLPNHMLLNIAETLPREMQGILACCNPIPPLVRQNLLKLYKRILIARDQPLIKPVLEEDLRQRLTQRNHNTNSQAWIYSPHDIPSETEIRADLPCLLDNVHAREESGDTVVRHSVTVFDSPVSSEDEETREGEQTERTRKKKKSVFVSPFERYKRVIPMVAQQEAQERERCQKEEEERLKELKKAEEETEESKDKVFEHYKKIYQTVAKPEENTPPKKASQVPLCQMRGRKRKKNSEGQLEVKEKSEDKFSTPVPSLETKIVQGVKREKEEVEPEESRKKQKKTAKAKTAVEGETFQLMRKREKGDKKANQKELKEKGMLPAEQFNYKTVDFSSFQGGSTITPTQVKLEQKTKQKRSRKRRKQKINI